MKINELVCENVENILILQNIYNEQQAVSAAIRSQLATLLKLKPKQFTTSYKSYLILKKKINYAKDEFNQLIDEYLLNINKLSIPTKQPWLQDFANLKI